MKAKNFFNEFEIIEIPFFFSLEPFDGKKWIPKFLLPLFIFFGKLKTFDKRSCFPIPLSPRQMPIYNPLKPKANAYLSIIAKRFLHN